MKQSTSTEPKHCYTRTKEEILHGNAPFPEYRRLLAEAAMFRQDLDFLKAHSDDLEEVAKLEGMRPLQYLKQYMSTLEKRKSNFINLLAIDA